MNKKLDDGQKHILRLIERDKREDGTALVSEQLYNVLSVNMPKELVTFEKLNNGGIVKLTDEGKAVIIGMKWL